MPRHELNHRAFEQAKVMVKDGKYVDEPWSFSAEDGNAILGEKGSENWSDYSRWFLGNDSIEDVHTKAYFAYPYGKGGKLYLSALRAIISRAGANADNQIKDAAQELLDAAKAKDADRETASGECDLYLNSGVAVDITAEAAIGASPALHRFSMVAYNGGPMMLNGKRKDIDYNHPVVVDLSGIGGIDKNRPALRQHDPDRVVGHTEHIDVSGGRMTATGVISNPHTDHSREIIHSSGNKFPWQSSIGANIGRVERVGAGEEAQVNGRTVVGPLTIARTSTLGEISFVALGADDTTSAVIAAKGGKESPVNFKAWAKAAGFSDEDMSGSKGKSIKAAWKCSKEYDKNDKDGEDNEPDPKDEKDKAKAESTVLDTANAGIADMRAEGVRQHEIQAAAAPHMATFAKSPKILKELNDIVAKAIADGIAAVDAAKDLELKALRSGRGIGAMQSDVDASTHAFNINSGGVGIPITSDIIASAIGLSAGLDEKHAFVDARGNAFPDNFKEVVTGKKFRGIGLQHMIGYVAAAHGIHLRPGPMGDDDIRRVMRFEQRMDLLGEGSGQDIQAAEGFSTISLLGITENLMNKMLLMGYDEQPSVVDDICWQRDTNDFKAFKSYRLSASGRMQLVNESGELKSIGLQDEQYSNQLKTWGMLITIGRQTILNDDLGSITDTPKQLGREAMMTREEQVFKLLFQLIAGTVQYNTAAPGAVATLVNFFSSGLGNYLSGAGSALGITALTSAIQKFMEQVDANGRPINVMPDRLLTSPAMRETAVGLNKGPGVVVTALGSTSAKERMPNYSMYSGQFNPIVSPFMAARSGKGVGGATANDTQWLLLPPPNSGLAIMQIGYLRGNRTPIIERGETTFSTLGMHMRAYYDFGIGANDYRAGVYNVGQ